MSDGQFGLRVGIGMAGRVVTAAVAFAGSLALARALGPGAAKTFSQSSSSAETEKL